MKRALVVGSGAGGAAAAARLQGTFQVTVLEEGRPFALFGRDLALLARLRSTRLLRDVRLIHALFPVMRLTPVADRMVLVHGSATGGSTTLSAGNGLRADQELRDLGIDLDDEFAALMQKVPISQDHAGRWRPVTRALFDTCRELGLDPQVMPKLIDFDRCTRCGRCVLGCPAEAKWDSRRILDEALVEGATLQTGAPVERVALAAERGGMRACGVIVRQRGRRRFIPADLVVLAAGGLGTPAILERSGIRTERRLWVDPVLCVAAPWPAAKQDAEVPMPFFLRRRGYLVSPYFDLLSFYFDPRWRRPGGEILSLMVKLADSEVGSVDLQGIRKGLTVRDHERLREAVELCSEILVAAGARRRNLFLNTINAGHPGGTLPLTGQERQALHADRLPPNVYVADASLLPRSLGAPPILTVMALSRRVARFCEERFG